MLLNVFVDSSMSKKCDKKHLFKIEIFCNIRNVFTVTFDQFNTSLLSKSINFFQKGKAFEL